MHFEKVVSEISSYINQFHDQRYTDWYIGLTSDPRKRLFVDHNVQEHGDLWIYRPTEGINTARLIEEYFIREYNFDGGHGGGDNNSVFVYTFLKTLHTKPKRNLLR